MRKAQRDKQQIETRCLDLGADLGDIIISHPEEEGAKMVHGPAALILTTVVKVGGIVAVC